MKIVLTGGPSAGKTSVVDIIHRSDSFQTVVVQESASVLFRGGFPRGGEVVHRQCQQRAIYHVQRELEEIGSFDGKDKSLVCDRGSLDGLAYWPGSEESFFSSIGSTMEAEISRYDWVIHLDTAAAADYQASEIRREASAEAAIVNEQVKHAWRLHPSRLIIPNNSSFLTKVNTTLSAVRMILANRTLADIRRELTTQLG